jgi:magnesium-transporting ATPase (P-type)
LTTGTWGGIDFFFLAVIFFFVTLLGNIFKSSSASKLSSEQALSLPEEDDSSTSSRITFYSSLIFCLSSYIKSFLLILSNIFYLLMSVSLSLSLASESEWNSFIPSSYLNVDGLESI